MFQDYLKTLNNEHREADNTLVEAQAALIRSQTDPIQIETSCQSVSEQENSQNLVSLENLEAIDLEREGGYSLSTCKIDCNTTQNDRVQSGEADVFDDGQKSCITYPIKSIASRVDGVSEFKEETKEVKSIVENFELEKLQLEEELSREQSKREVY